MVSKSKTTEPQYNMLFDVEERYGRSAFGLMANEAWNQDPRRTVFTLSRYKFVAKMLEGRAHVLEVGCADAFGTRVVQQTTGRVTVTDFDPALLADAESRVNSHWPMNIRRHDWVTDGPIPEGFDAAFGLDVLEHIDPTDETVFLSNIAASMLPSGVCIMGMPSLESQTYASPQSREGHVNCKSGKDLRDTMSQFFETVFVFSMNDEVVHTGFFPMAQYLLAVGSHPRH